LTDSNRKEERLLLASYTGAISRFCSIMGMVPGPENKQAEEFKAFNRWMTDKAEHRRQQQAEWDF